MQNSDFRDFLTGNINGRSGERNRSRGDSAEMFPSVLSNYNLMPRAINTKKRKIAADDGEKSTFSISPEADSDYHKRAAEYRRGVNSIGDLESKDETTVSQVETPAKGLDYELLNKVRIELQKSTEEELEKVAIIEPKAKLSRDELLATLKKSRPSDEKIPLSRFKPITQPKKEKKKKRKEKTIVKNVEVIKKDVAVTEDKPKEEAIELQLASAPPDPPSPIDEEKGIFSDVEEYKLGQSDSDSDSDQGSALLPSIMPGKYFDDDPQEATQSESNNIIKGVLQRVKEERIRAEKAKEATVGIRKPIPIQELDKGTDDSYEYDTSGLATGDLRELDTSAKVSSGGNQSKKSEKPRKERRKDSKANAKLDREHAELEKFMQKDA